MCYVVLCYVVLCCVLFCVTMCCVVLYYIILYCIVLYCVVLWYVVLCSVASCGDMLCCVFLLSCIVLCCFVLCCYVFCNIINLFCKDTKVLLQKWTWSHSPLVIKLEFLNFYLTTEQRDVSLDGIKQSFRISTTIESNASLLRTRLATIQNLPATTSIRRSFHS